MELRFQPAKSGLYLERHCLLKLLSGRAVVSTLDLSLTFCLTDPRAPPGAPLPAVVASATPLPGFAAHRPPQAVIRFRILRGAGRGGGNAHARRDPARAERAARRLRVREGPAPAGWRVRRATARVGASGGLGQGFKTPGAWGDWGLEPGARAAGVRRARWAGDGFGPP